jgi:hypothetical protein
MYSDDALEHIMRWIVSQVEILKLNSAFEFDERVEQNRTAFGMVQALDDFFSSNKESLGRFDMDLMEMFHAFMTLSKDTAVRALEDGLALGRYEALKDTMGELQAFMQGGPPR